VVLETKRLILRELLTDDNKFILRLLNEPSFIENIEDKGVRTLEDATAYLLNGPIASYKKNGFGLWLVLTKDTNTAIGMCGLIKRDILKDVDIGYAFFPEYCSKGYALESATAVMSYAKEQLGLKRLLALVNFDNQRSIKLLDKLGFHYERNIQLSAQDEKEVRLFGTTI
jgi:RimJ/RimL family protein N-acetyltransferase